MSKKPNLPAIAAVLKEGSDPKFVVLDYADYRKFILALGIQVKVDEDHYLQSHPSVKLAVASGRYPDGSTHYSKHGYFEGKRAKVVGAPKPKKTLNSKKVATVA